MLENKWDRRFFLIATQVSGWSKDPNCRVGAVLVSPDRRNISIGYNGFPKDIPDDQVMLNMKEVKNHNMVHAEHNALMNATFETEGCSLYVTMFPCTKKGCCRSILNAGISRLISWKIDPVSSWAEDQLKSEETFRQAGIEIIFANIV
jgi:dCMP deaminase